MSGVNNNLTKKLTGKSRNEISLLLKNEVVSLFNLYKIYSIESRKTWGCAHTQDYVNAQETPKKILHSQEKKDYVRIINSLA